MGRSDDIIGAEAGAWVDHDTPVGRGEGEDEVQGMIALLPASIEALLLLRGLQPAWAAAAGYVVSLALLLAFPTSLPALLEAHRHALLLALEVGAILLGGIAFDELTRQTGTVTQLASRLQRLVPNPSRFVLLVVLGLTPFFESITGFGIGAVIAVSLLRAVGYRGAPLGILSLLGLVAVPWGALAPGTLVAARLTGLSFTQLGIASALLSLPLFLLSGLVALALAAGRDGLRTAWPLLLQAGLALWLGISAANAVFGTPLAGALGSLFAIAALLGNSLRHSLDRNFLRAFSPYGVLIGLLLLGRITAPALAPIAPSVASVTTHPAVALALACLALWRRDRPSRPLALWLLPAIRRWRPAASTTLLFLGLGSVLIASGLTTELARLIATLRTGVFLAVPWLAGFGGFFTGSNTGANAMFAAAQHHTAGLLGLSPLLLIGVHNVAASWATMASPVRFSLVQSMLAPAEWEPRIPRTILATVGGGLTLLALEFLVILLSTHLTT